MKVDKRKLKIGAGLLLVALVLVVIFQNREPMDLRLLFATITMPLAALLALTLLLGMLAGLLLAFGLAKRPAKKP